MPPFHYRANTIISAHTSSRIPAAAAIGFSYHTQGNAPLAAAALGFCSIITAVSSVVYGIFAMMEKEKNYILAKICLAAAGILLLVWALMIVFAL